MRTTKALRTKLERAVGSSGRSLVQEVEFRLEQSFTREECMAQMKTVALIAANNEQLRAQMQTVLDEVAATLAAAQIAINLLDSKVNAVREDLARLQAQVPQEGDTPQPNA